MFRRLPYSKVMRSRRERAALPLWARFAFIAALCQVAVVLPAASGASSTADAQQQQATLSNSWGEVTPEAERLISWIRDHGGVANVEVRTLPDLGRKVFAPHDIKTGHVLAEIPHELCYKLDATSNDDMLEETAAAVQLFTDMHNPNSFFHPFFKMLPTRNNVWSYYDIPESYLPLIQNEMVEANIVDLQKDRLVQINGGSSSSSSKQRQDNSVSSSHESVQPNVEDLRYIMTLMETRGFTRDTTNTSLQFIPLIDMADHRNDCPHIYYEDACSSSMDVDGAVDAQDSAACYVWEAGEDVAAGQEVCHNYRYLLQDVSLIQYGYLQEGPAAGQLSRLDRHDFDPQEPFAETTAVNEGGSPFEADSAEQCRTELTRLKQLLTELKTRDESLKPTLKPHPRDIGGWFLQQLWTWREQRQAAITAEIERLEKILVRFVELESVVGLPKPQAAYDKLVAWMEKNGAQVNVAVKPITNRQQQHCLKSTASNSCSASTDTSACDTGFTGKEQAGDGDGASTTSDSAATSCSQDGFGSLHGVYAKKDIKAGDVIAVIPTSITYLVKGGSSDLLEAALEILLSQHQLSQVQEKKEESPRGDSKDTNAKGTFWEAYFAVLPTLGSLKTMQNFPSAYLNLLQDKQLEVLVSEAKSQAAQMWHKQRPAADASTNSTLTLADLEHMTAVVSTRVMALGAAGLRMVPLVDLAKHDNNCQHNIEVEQCTLMSQAHSAGGGGAGVGFGGNDAGTGSNSSGANGLCLYWKAGVDLAAGEDVCSGHRGHLLPDVALLQYGILMPQHQQQQQHDGNTSPELYGIDRSDMDILQLFGGPGVVSGQQPPITGTRVQAVTEAARLTVRLQRVASAEAQTAAAAVQPASEDWGGRLLQLLHVWKQQRIAALEAGISRIVQLHDISSDELALEVAVIQQQEAEAEAEAEAATEAYDEYHTHT